MMSSLYQYFGPIHMESLSFISRPYINIRIMYNKMLKARNTFIEKRNELKKKKKKEQMKGEIAKEKDRNQNSIDVGDDF